MVESTTAVVANVKNALLLSTSNRSEAAVGYTTMDGDSAASLFEDAPQGPFSLNVLWDRALDKERLYGVRLDGRWMHVGTPEALKEAEASFEREGA